MEVFKSLVAYTDCLAVVAVEANHAKLTENVIKMLREILDWMKTKHLTVAQQKAEAIMLSGRKRYGDIISTLGYTEIRPQDTLIYFGVMLDRYLRFNKHIENAASTATKSA